MYLFNDKNINLLEFLIHDAVISENSIQFVASENLLEIFLIRPDWNNTSCKKFLFYKELRVYSANSKVKIKGVDYYTFENQHNIHNDLTITHVNYSLLDEKIVIYFIDAEISIKINKDFSILIEDVGHNVKAPYLKIINGNDSHFRKWAFEYNKSISSNL